VVILGLPGKYGWCQAKEFDAEFDSVLLDAVLPQA
jgi:hypothetical protein